MTPVKLSRTRIQEGIWHGILSHASTTAPQVEVTHREATLPDIEITATDQTGEWAMQVPIPAQALSDGVQTLVLRDTAADTQVGHVTLMLGEIMGDDMRAEVDLLRAELDLLKRAFRRHCNETT